MNPHLLLRKKRESFERELTKSLASFGEENSLKEACRYALLSGGKRFRPLLVLLMAEALGSHEPYQAALSVEYFHTASLIADDLPCMDNDAMRRGRPSLHTVFGETVALLASYALITAAFERIHLAALSFPVEGVRDTLAHLGLKEASRLAGIMGATGGQYYDIFPQPSSLESVRRVLFLKTVTLFELSFLFGWIFGGGDLKRIDEVKKLSHHFGMAFQICDDLRDLSQDRKRENQMNLGLHLGEERARDEFFQEMKAFSERVKDLHLENSALVTLQSLLQERLPDLAKRM